MRSVPAASIPVSAPHTLSVTDIKPAEFTLRWIEPFRMNGHALKEYLLRFMAENVSLGAVN